MAPARSAGSDNSAADSGDRHEADVTGRLSLALTSLYVLRPVHTAEEQRQYGELMLRLMDKTGPAARAAVAARLRRHPDAPVEVIARLGDVWSAGDDGTDGDPPHAVRDQQTAGSLCPEGDPCPDDGEPAPAPEPSAPAPPPTAEIGAAFFAASPAERRRLLSLLTTRADAAAAPESSRRFHVRIDAAAWRGRTDAFVRDFARMIDAPKTLGERILNDPSGEPVVIAAKASGMPVALLQRILVLLSPVVSHPVQRVHELTDLYHDLDSHAARDLLAAWRGQAEDPPPQTAPPAVTNLRARFGALNARLQNQGVGSRGSRQD